MFLKLTLATNGEPIGVNMDKVVSMAPTHKQKALGSVKGTHLRLAEGDMRFIQVSESMHDILYLLNSYEQDYFTEDISY
jgi:hypothetical protein